MNHSRFRSNTTIRWSFRSGDYLLWVAFKGLAAFRSRDADDQFGIADIWELKNGDFATITDRHDDLPDWFELHPFETSNSAARWMKRKLDAGYEPTEPVDGPNIWRVRAGDRIIWVGGSRSDIKSEEGILGIMEFMTDAAVIGEPFDFSSGLPTFGRFGEKRSPELLKLFRKGFHAACRLGLPNEISVDRWAIGS
ncbi:MAG: hypothetical protein LLG06_07910 [Desulfobacteraceae bacterium]|nr:hypothetical protein [Desulfobacteraceae bacterium]